MPWHIEWTAGTARYFPDGDEDANFAARKKPVIISQIARRADGSAYIHATMSRTDGATSPGIWRDLARKLRAMGVKVLDWEHAGKASSVDPARAWADTVAVVPPEG